MSKINFEEDVANIDQEGLESVSGLLQQQLKMETEVELAELELKYKMIPLKIKRPLPNGKFEIWKISELDISQY